MGPPAREAPGGSGHTSPKAGAAAFSEAPVLDFRTNHAAKPSPLPKIQNSSLKKQYEKLKQENEQLVKDNEQLKQDYQILKAQNETIIKENENYKKDIKELNETFNQNQSQNDLLQKQFDGTLRHYGITKDVFEEYKEENNSQKIKDILNNIQTELKEAEDLLKEYIEKKQKQVNQIRQKIKPE